MAEKKGITSEEKVEIFKAELDRIFDRKIREFTKLCIIAAPDYFFLDCPASSSGRYHRFRSWDMMARLSIQNGYLR
jgi:hypothetical protein